MNALYRTAESLGVDVRYEAEVTHLDLVGDKVVEVVFDQDGQEQRVKPKAVVAASGGFQGDTDWLERAWGEGAQNFLIRGTKYNRGVVLRDLLDQGWHKALVTQNSATPWRLMAARLSLMVALPVVWTACRSRWC